MNRHALPLYLRGALLVLAAVGTLQAQDAKDAQGAGFSKDLKIRMGYGLETKDHLRASAIGIGFNVAYGSSAGKFGLEMGYYYKTGDQYLEPISGTVPASLSPLDAARSGDSRRNQVDGFAVRLSFQKSFSESWDWQAGLMLGGTRFKHEYVGDVEGQNWNSGNATSWRDTYSGTPTEGGMKVSPYAGVSVKISEISSLEFNLMLLNYTAIDYVHHPGSATQYSLPADTSNDPGRLSDHNAFPSDSLEKHNRLVPHLELAYVFRF